MSTRQFTGGVGSWSSGSFTLGDGSKAFGSVSFGGDFALPTLRAYTQAGAASRTNSNLFGFQSFTYNGSSAIDLALKGDLHYVNSGNSSPFVNTEFAGEGLITAYVGLWSLSAIAGISTADDIVRNMFYAACGTPYVMGAASFRSLGAGGDHNATLNLSSACSGGTLRVNPGDSFMLAAGMQTPSNRGGFVDARSTFKILFDEENTVFADTGTPVGMNTLAASITTAVPEPATWAMMIGGFGAVGFTLRRRKSLALA
jgi:hypothetical protein